jgi:hypothetical protein
MLLASDLLAPEHSHTHLILTSAANPTKFKVSHNLEAWQLFQFGGDESSRTGANYALGISHGPLDEPRQGSYFRSLLPPTQSPQSVSFDSSPPESRDLFRWPTSISGDIPTSSTRVGHVSSNVWPGYNQQGRPLIYPPQAPVPTFEVSPVEGQKYVPAFDAIAAHDLYPLFLRPPFSNNQDMGGTEDYPSPHSDRGRQNSIATSTSMPESVAADHATTPSSAGSKGLQISIKRGEPPRNEMNEIYCTHLECAGKVVTFRRPCEWK